MTNSIEQKCLAKGVKLTEQRRTIARVISELFREPVAQIGYLFNLFSMGTILSVLMITTGLIIFYLKRNEN